MTVEVDDEVGIDVADAARNDERVIYAVRDLDIAVSVFDGGKKFVDRFDLHLVGNDVVEISRINSVRFRLVRKSAHCQRDGEQGDDGKAQKDREQYFFDFCVHITPPIAMPAQTER